MKTSALKYAILSWAATVTMLIILLMPFHAFLTVWLSSGLGHYTALRLWKEVLLLFCGLGLLFLLATDHRIRSHTLTRRLVWLILLYVAVNLIWGAVAYQHHAVSLKALGYGLVSNLRFPLFFLVTWAIALRIARLRVHWQWMILWPAGIVIVFGLLQIFILPHNFLSHFGYGPHTIAAYETINHNQHYIRIMATLRGANPLGAYLLIPISLLTVLLFRGKRPYLYGTMLAGAAMTLFFTFSRSAWLGAVLSVVTIIVVSVRSQRARQIAYGAGGLVLVLGLVSAIALRHNARFENFIFHTQHNSAIKSTSDSGHSSALKTGARQLLHEPLGRGPGSAGPASVYNVNHPTRIAENYYIQVGQETGWLGLMLFLLINIGVGVLLWVRRDHSLVLSLFASFVGLCFINMLAHAWGDDTLAYIWWGLAGIALAPGLNPEE